MNPPSYTYETTSPYRKNGYDVKIDSKEKDMLISQLKAHIFELKQHEKDYDQLNAKFRQIQSDCSLLQEAKNRLEYEQRQKDDGYSKQLCDLRAENENLQLEFNDKLAINKRLFIENDNIMQQLEMKNNEIMDLNDQINELMAQMKKRENDNCSLEMTIQGLNDIKESQKNELGKLIEDNRTLSKVIQDQDRSIKVSEQDRLALTSRLNKANYDLQNLSGKLQSKEDNLLHTQSQLDNLNNVSLQLKGKLSDYERQFENQRKDIEALKSSLNKERCIREEEEKNNAQLERLLNQKERDIEHFSEEIDNAKNANRRMNDDKMSIQIENDQLGKHIMILTQQNQKLIEEIENVMDQDEKMKQSLNRKDRIVALLRNNNSTIEASLNNLDNFLNRSSSFNTTSKSPKYTYDRSSNSPMGNNSNNIKKELMNNDFNEKYLKKSDKEEIIFKQKSPLLYKKKASEPITKQETINTNTKTKDTPTILLPVNRSSSLPFKSEELRIAQLEKDIEDKKKAYEDAISYNNKLQEKVAKLQECLVQKDTIIKEIEESIVSFEEENKKLQEEIEAKANEPRQHRERQGQGQDRRAGRGSERQQRMRLLENNLLHMLLNMRRIRQDEPNNGHHYPNPDNMTYEELLELEERMGNVSKGLSSDAISKIKVKRYSSKVNRHNDKCIICQFELKENEQVKVLNCDHCFHGECLDEWLKNEKKCPVCKKEVI